MYWYPILFDGEIRVDPTKVDYHGWEEFGISLDDIGNSFYLKEAKPFFSTPTKVIVHVFKHLVNYL